MLRIAYLNYKHLPSTSPRQSGAFSIKEPKCTICGGGHYKTFCYMAPKKAIKVSPIKRSKPVYKTYTQDEIKSLYQAKKPTSKPKSLRKQLIIELDTLFSRYIRLKKSVNGIGTCVTCSRQYNWRDMDCGHFISRGHFGTRFDEKNCHIQCQDCNRHKSGNMKLYRIYMESLYGVDGVQALVNKSRQPLATYEIKEKIAYYKEMLLTFA